MNLGRKTKRAFGRLSLLLSSLTLGLLLLELTLRLIGFTTVMQPVVTGAASPGGNTGNYMMADPELRWRLRAGGALEGVRVNAQGFFGREVVQPKPPGTTRVTCIGDSCTADAHPAGSPTWPDLLHQLISTNRPGWEAHSQGVHGYSVVQGLRHYELYGRAFQPDVVVIYFGWNDHWRHGEGGRTDRQHLALRMSPWRKRMHDRLTPSRLYQWLWSLRSRSADSADNPEGLRVPPDDYSKTLIELVQQIQADGARPILVTAPRAANITDLLVERGQTLKVEDAIRRHDAYVKRTREISKQTGVTLVDAAARMARHPDLPLFKRDGIHLTWFGRGFLAQIVFEAL